MKSLFNNFYKFSNSIALIDEKYEKITYSALIRCSDEIKSKLKSKSVAVLISNNNTDFICGYIAFLRKKNIISILVDISLSKEFILDVISSYKPNYILCPKSLNFELEELQTVYESLSYKIYETNNIKHKNLNFKNFLLRNTKITSEKIVSKSGRTLFSFEKD